MKNGRFWRSIADSPEAQSIFLAGLVDGWSLRGSTEENIPGKVLVAFGGTAKLTYAQLAEMVSAAYSDPENLNLPIGWVLLADFSIEKGEANKEAVFTALRKYLARPGLRVGPFDPISTIMDAAKKSQH